MEQKHCDCELARGIRGFKCVKCGSLLGVNYMNGVDICGDCILENDLCCICGKTLNKEE